MLRLPMQAHDAPTATEPQYLTLPEAARRLGVSIDTLRRRVKDGTLPHIFLARKYRIRTDHLDEWARAESVA